MHSSTLAAATTPGGAGGAPRVEDVPRAAKIAEIAARPDDAILMAWRRFGPLVRRTLEKMLGADEEVRDLSQEAFLQLQRNLRSLRSPDAIGPFVAGIAVRLALQEIRRRRVRGGQVLLPGQGLVPPTSTTVDPEAREAVARLLGVVGQLRAADQDMFVLRQIKGLEQTQIVEATRLSLSTVRRRLRRLERRIGILAHADPALADYARRGQRRSS